MGFHVLVLAGGSGTRLWPLSRVAEPKHLLPLAPGGRTLLRDTLERVLDLADSCRVVTAAAQADRCREEMSAVGLPASWLIAEPVARGTGPALGLAVGLVAREDPDALIATVHADHRVDDAAGYRSAVVASAGWAAATRGLATVGLAPTFPATGFGYIEVGERRAGGPASLSPPAPASLDHAAGVLEAFAGVRFVEKPAEDVARGYVAGGRHLWNLGLFAWPARVFLDELAGADPALAASVARIVEATPGDEASRAYAALDPIPVESLVLERTGRLTVVRASFSWSDLGSWLDVRHSLVDAGEADVDGNVLEGDALAAGSRDCLVLARGGRLVTVVGAASLVVIDTPDAVLIVPADQAQRVKEAVDRLRTDGRADVL